MSDTTQSLRARARAVTPGGVNSALRFTDAPMIFTQAQGAYITDSDGKQYIDYHGAFGPMVLGHRHPEVDAAVKRTMDTLDLTGFGVSEVEIGLAEKICKYVPSAEKTHLACSGSEATYNALRLARAVTGRMKIIKFQGTYHGWYDYVCMNVMSAADKVGKYDVFSTGVLPAAIEHTLILPLNDLDAVRDTIRREGDQIAAVIIEPVVHNSGCIMPVPGYLEGLRQICDDNKSLLIFDEVITGIRHDLGGYQKLCGVTPDLTCLGKALGNGYQISALCGKARYMDRFSTAGGDVFFAGTFMGTPLSVAGGLATMEVLERGEAHPRLFKLGDLIRTELDAVVKKLGVPAHCAQFGSLFVLYFCEPPITRYEDLLRNDNALDAAVRKRLFAKGIALHPKPLARAHISAAHSEDDIARTVRAYREAIEESLPDR